MDWKTLAESAGNWPALWLSFGSYATFAFGKASNGRAK